MSVIPLTVFFSLLLAGTFVVLFLRDQRRRHLTSPERDSLLPLADEQAHVVARNLRAGARRTQRSAAERVTRDSDPEDRCACRTGQRPPCAGCLRRLDEQEPAYF